MTPPKNMVVIGAGLPRTGTFSTKAALEKLLGGQCYHMFVVLGTPGNTEVDFWNKAFDQGISKDEWKAFLEERDYRATIDYPTSLFFREQMEAFPDAKVVMSVRPPSKWHDSVNNTILPGVTSMISFPTNLFLKLTGKLDAFTAANRTARYIPPGCEDCMFGSVEKGYKVSEKFFNDWVAEVKRVVPPERLLVFEVKDGWGPLCKFLDLPIPDEPFPRVNDTETLRKTFMRTKIASWIIIVGLPILAAILTMYWYM